MEGRQRAAATMSHSRTVRVGSRGGAGEAQATPVRQRVPAQRGTQTRPSTSPLLTSTSGPASHATPQPSSGSDRTAKKHPRPTKMREGGCVHKHPRVQNTAQKLRRVGRPSGQPPTTTPHTLQQPGPSSSARIPPPAAYLSPHRHHLHLRRLWGNGAHTHRRDNGNHSTQGASGCQPD